MKKIFLLGLILILSACSILGGEKTPEITETPTEVPTATPLPQPQVMVTAMPDASETAKAFLAAWEAENYVEMYNMLSTVSRDTINLDAFIERYDKTAIAMTLDHIETEITSSLTNPGSAQVACSADYYTHLVGMLSRNLNMELVNEFGTWKVRWDDSMILPELQSGYNLIMDIDVPTRGAIYDRNGVALAYETNAYSLGVVPGMIDPAYWTGVINEFSRLTGKTPQVITELMKSADPAEYVIIGEVTAETMEARYSYITSYTGITVNEYHAPRYYTEGGIGTHIMGYVQPITEEESKEMQRAGYRIDERIGRMGVEKWAQDQLDGTRGAALYLADAEGNMIDRLARTEALAANSLYLTYDEDFQYDLQRAIAGFNAGVVVLERDTGRVLGMASSPNFDANLLDYNNTNAFYSGDEIYNENRPMYNRATQGQYPLGSVFKIIGMAAALETGIYQLSDTYECGYDFTELDGVTLHDWTLDHEVAPSGTLNLSEALMRSCNPWFYKIGMELYNRVNHDALSHYARAFGLGSPTGIDIEEEPGNVDTPKEVFDAVQLGIGQSTLLVTPLQVARFVAAVGNGGTLYRPQVVEQIVDPAGNVIQSFEPDPNGTLPVTPEHLKMIQDAMETVVRNPRGTAYNTFTNIKYNVHAKTGSASTAEGFDSNAWFAGYTDEQDPKKPDIAIAVVAEKAGEGADVGAPIFRRVLELYFEGQAKSLYRWEAAVYVTKTSSPTPTATPTPKPTRAPWEATAEAEEFLNSVEGEEEDIWF